MSLNYNYIVERARDWGPEVRGGPKLLDYGCGTKAAIVRLALDAGFDAHGVDPFYEGGVGEERVKETGLRGTHIHRLLEDGTIPMRDGSFDVVTANQVFEHIDDFTVPLAEIARVMKPKGIFINIFPSLMIWREGHNGIPFSHWFSPSSRVRYLYTLAARSLGLGSYKNGKTRRQWTEHKLNWIDTWTHYKTLSEIIEAFSRRFTIDSREADYLLYRIERHRILRKGLGIARMSQMEPVLKVVAQRLSGHVFLLRKRVTQ